MLAVYADGSMTTAVDYAVSTWPTDLPVSGTGIYIILGMLTGQNDARRSCLLFKTMPESGGWASMRIAAYSKWSIYGHRLHGTMKSRRQKNGRGKQPVYYFAEPEFHYCCPHCYCLPCLPVSSTPGDAPVYNIVLVHGPRRSSQKHREGPTQKDVY